MRTGDVGVCTNFVQPLQISYNLLQLATNLLQVPYNLLQIVEKPLKTATNRYNFSTAGVAGSVAGLLVATTGLYLAGSERVALNIFVVFGGFSTGLAVYKLLERPTPSEVTLRMEPNTKVVQQFVQPPTNFVQSPTNFVQPPVQTSTNFVEPVGISAEASTPRAIENLFEAMD